jgi:hypothetical protein
MNNNRQRADRLCATVSASYSYTLNFVPVKVSQQKQKVNV